jgi:glycosyltransferase involved in cell wall biosynthesis
MPTDAVSADPSRPHVLVVFPGKQETGEGWGGVFNASAAHVHALRTAGARVTVWTASAPFARVAADEGATVDYHPCWHSGLSPLFSPRCWRAAARLRADGLVGALHQGGRTGGWGRILLPGIPQAGVMHREKPSSYRFFRHLLTLSEGYRRQLETDPAARGKKIAAARNGLLSAPALPARRLDVRTGPPVIGFLGRMHSVKGIGLLLEAAGLLRAEGRDFRLVVAGGPPGEWPALAARHGVAEVTSFPGWTDRPESFYAATDIFCLPSRNEPFGLVLIEAMAQGLPVVATRCNGPLGIVTPEHDGLLTPPGEVAPLAAALRRLLDDEALRHRLGAAARQTAHRDFGPAAVGRSLLRALASYHAPGEEPETLRNLQT